MTVPGDEHELRQEIEQTRTALAQTVDQLAAKADVKAAARAKAGQARQRVKSQTARIRAKAEAKAGPVWQQAPERVRRSLARGASTAQRRPMPMAAVAATLIAGYLAMRWWAKR
jgi:cell division septum initiation protein DivIVA